MEATRQDAGHVAAVQFCTNCTALREGSGAVDVCADCASFQAGYDDGLVQRELEHVLVRAKRQGAILLELSGGRHSVMALALLRLRLGLEVVAVTLSNGYIPAQVIRQARELASALGARHLIVEAALEAEASLTSDPVSIARCCTACNRHLSSALLQVSNELGLTTSANGENKYRALVPRVTATGWIGMEGGHRIRTINLPFAMRIKRKEGEELLERIGWKETGVPGMSSNCLVPWISAEARQLRNQGNPLVEMIAAEVRSGYLSRQEGFAALDRISTASVGQVRAVRRQNSRWSRARPVPRVVYDSAASHSCPRP